MTDSIFKAVLNWTKITMNEIKLDMITFFYHMMRKRQQSVQYQPKVSKRKEKSL